MTNPDDLLDIKEAAAFLHVSGTSLRRWTNEGLLPCLRVGRRRERRFRRSDLLAFMEVEPALAVTEVIARREADGTALLDGRSDHLCALYSTDAGRTRLAAAFLADGLHHGSQCFLIAERSVREAIVTRLRRDRAALPDGFDESRLVVAEYTTSGNAQLDFFAAAFETATSTGATALRVVGDVWKLAVHISPDELADYESRYHQLAHQFGAVTRCHYDVRRFSGIELLAALRSHPDLLRRPPDAVLE